MYKMKRIIVGYKKLNKDILDLLVTQYPYGFDEEDAIFEKDDGLIDFDDQVNDDFDIDF